MRTQWNPLALIRRQGLLLPLLSTELKAVTRNTYLGLTFTSNLIMVAVLVALLRSRAGTTNETMTLWMTALLAATPAMNYASFCFAKDGLYYAGYVTRLTLLAYARQRVLFTRVYSIAGCALMLPFIWNGTQWPVVAFGAMAVYYAGFGGMLMVYVSSFDRNKIRLSAPPMFNSQGISLWKALFVMPATTPLFFFEELRLVSLWITVLLGVAGFCLSGWMTGLIEKNLAKRKHRYLAL